jgi:hypothetical protein
VAFPDTCKTQVGPATTPLPYPNVADTSDSKGSSCSKKVVIENKKICLKKSEISTSVGDEPGALKGTLSNQNKGKAFWTEWYDKVLVEGQPIVYWTCGTEQNCAASSNTRSKNVKSSQRKVKKKPSTTKAKDKANLYHSQPNKKYKPNKKAREAAQNRRRKRSKKSKVAASETMGEEGALQAARSFFGDKIQQIATFAGKNTVDILVTLTDGTVAVIEAKGGKSPRGSRKIGRSRYKQGTPEYLKGTADKMSKSKGSGKIVQGGRGSMSKAVAGDKISAAQAKGKCRYFHAKTDADGNISLKEFDP